MLSMSSINIPTSGTPVVPVSRPALVTEVARSASPLAEIQPTTAISRERSRTEPKPQSPATTGEAVVQQQAEGVVLVKAIATRALANSPGRRPQDAPANGGQDVAERPPSEKNPIQKALDTQIKDVLSTVWKASGKAVDFLLGRRESLMDRTLKEVLLPREVDYLGANPGTTAAPAVAGNNPEAMVSYTAQGGSGSLGDGRGKLLDLVA